MLPLPFLKRLVERSLVAAGAPRAFRALRGGDAVILAYHNVVPDGEAPGGDRSLHLTQSDFARQLDLLTESHRVVSLPRLLARGETKEEGQTFAALTFDDGYRGALTVGLEELAARGLPCTVFVAPALLGRDALWWDALSPGVDERRWPSLREKLLTDAKGQADAVWKVVDRCGLEPRTQPDHAGIVREDELAEAVGQEGVSLGSHGWSHANLTVLGNEELKKELARSLEWLRERFPERTSPWLSLPYGRTSREVIRAAGKSGYHGVLDLSGRLVRTGAVRHRAPRINVPAGISVERFLLLTAGL